MHFDSNPKFVFKSHLPKQLSILKIKNHYYSFLREACNIWRGGGESLWLGDRATQL